MSLNNKKTRNYEEHQEHIDALMIDLERMVKQNIAKEIGLDPSAYLESEFVRGVIDVEFEIRNKR